MIKKLGLLGVALAALLSVPASASVETSNLKGGAESLT